MKKIADKQNEMLRILNNNGDLTEEFVERKLAHKNGIYHQEVAFIPVSTGGGNFASTQKQR